MGVLDISSYKFFFPIQMGIKIWLQAYVRDIMNLVLDYCSKVFHMNFWFSIAYKCYVYTFKCAVAHYEVCSSIMPKCTHLNFKILCRWKMLKKKKYNGNITHHWSWITITYNSNEKIRIIVRVTIMWCRDREWANALGKMTPMDLLNAGLPQTFTL